MVYRCIGCGVRWTLEQPLHACPRCEGVLLPIAAAQELIELSRREARLWQELGTAV